MERAYNAVKAFILEKVNPCLPAWESEDAKMPPLAERAIGFGMVDPLRTAGETLCAVYPESLSPAGEEIGGGRTVSLAVTVSFLMRQAPYEELAKRMSRYAACFRACAAKDSSLGGAARDSEVTEVNFLPDCGPAERQAAGVEIGMNIIFEEDLNGHFFDKEAFDDGFHKQGDKRLPRMGAGQKGDRVRPLAKP